MQRQCFYMQRQCFYVQKQCFCSQRLWCMESPRNSAFLHKNTKKTLIPNSCAPNGAQASKARSLISNS